MLGWLQMLAAISSGATNPTKPMALGIHPSNVILAALDWIASRLALPEKLVSPTTNRLATDGLWGAQSYWRVLPCAHHLRIVASSGPK